MNEFFPDDEISYKLIIYSSGVVYFADVDNETLDFVIDAAEFMLNSQIEDVIENAVYGSAMKMEEEKNEFHPANEPIPEVPQSNISPHKTCPKCNVKFIDFFFRNQGGCSACWVYFKDELEFYLNHLYGVVEKKFPDGIPIPPPNFNQPNQIQQPYPHPLPQTHIDELPYPQQAPQGTFNHFMPLPVAIPPQMMNVGFMPMVDPIDHIRKLKKEKERKLKDNLTKIKRKITKGFDKFVSGDQEYLKKQIEINENVIKNMINNDKYESARILSKKINKMKKRLQDGEKKENK